MRYLRWLQDIKESNDDKSIILSWFGFNPEERIRTQVFPSFLILKKFKMFKSFCLSEFESPRCDDDEKLSAANSARFVSSSSTINMKTKGRGWDPNCWTFCSILVYQIAYFEMKFFPAPKKVTVHVVKSEFFSCLFMVCSPKPSLWTLALYTRIGGFFSIRMLPLFRPRTKITSMWKVNLTSCRGRRGW